MTSRWKKIWADLWGNKSRTILTILTIMVGTFAVGINSNLGQYMSESMEEDFLSALLLRLATEKATPDTDSVKPMKSQKLSRRP